jgi:hypothetical protein
MIVQNSVTAKKAAKVMRLLMRLASLWLGFGLCVGSAQARGETRGDFWDNYLLTFGYQLIQPKASLNYDARATTPMPDDCGPGSPPDRINCTAELASRNEGTRWLPGIQKKVKRTGLFYAEFVPKGTLFALDSRVDASTRSWTEAPQPLPPTTLRLYGLQLSYFLSVGVMPEGPLPDLFVGLGLSSIAGVGRIAVGDRHQELRMVALGPYLEVESVWVRWRDMVISSYLGMAITQHRERFFNQEIDGLSRFRLSPYQISFVLLNVGLPWL